MGGNTKNPVLRAKNRDKADKPALCATELDSVSATVRSECQLVKEFTAEYAFQPNNCTNKSVTLKSKMQCNSLTRK